MKKEEWMIAGENPVIRADFPDPDVIRVGDTYYMLSTTLHFLPGAEILRSYDLVNWEIAGYVVDKFEGTEEARMKNERSNYGCGMWQGSLRYHKGRFYVSFAAKETCKTYFYSAENIEGPWESSCIDFYFHHGSLFFDEDDRVYLIFGHGDIWIRELLPDLSGLKPGGFLKKLLVEEEDVWMAYEGSHFYKIGEKYYLFVVNWPKKGTARRIQHCFVSDSLDGEFKGKCVLDDDMGFGNNGIAQGGLVETIDGLFYAMLMQDRGAAGRFPILIPVTWKDSYPVYGTDLKAPVKIETEGNRPHYDYQPLYTSDDFRYEKNTEGKVKLKPQWQWNHEPNDELWDIVCEGGLAVTTGKLCTNVAQAVNTLTQRMFYPASSVEVTVDASDIMEGDFAGLCALQGCYGMVAVTREVCGYYLVMLEREDTEKNRTTSMGDYMPGVIIDKISVPQACVRLRMEANFENGKDTITFWYSEAKEESKWKKIGGEHKTYFGMDHFAGVRCGLSIFATKKAGGKAVFRDFVYENKK